MSSLPPKRRVLSKSQEIQIQHCERRLVLSAQMLFDVLGDQALQAHGSLDQQLSCDSDLDSHQISPQSTAHNLTGWTQMQQQFGLTGKGQTVAVIDSGIAWDHVALGRGFGAGYRVVGGWDFTEENDANPYDDGPSGYHGTHVAGIIGSDDPTRAGVAPDVDLVALRVFNDLGSGNMSWVEKALQWVHTNRDTFENPITTVNLSLGSTWNSSNVPDWAVLEDELKALHDEGILVTASAGNSFKSYNAPGLSYPAASSYVLPVASVDDNGQLSDFSQRDDRVLAAPGRNIMSTVPDHLLGRDGRVNDFSLASGTSMAAPYVAGASVLVRQAMEMAGWNNITPDSIAEHLRSTADSVFDSITNASYDRLDLQQAIDSIIPDDNIGDVAGSAHALDLNSGSLGSWINSLQDTDIFRFTAAATGTLNFDVDSNWVESLSWTMTSGGANIDSGALSAKTIALVQGQTYEIRLSADNEIGPYQLGFSFQADSSGGGGGSTSPTQIGAVDYWSGNVNAGSSYRVQATDDGTFTVLWKNTDAATGQITLAPVGGTSVVDTSWDNGALRLDVQAKAGQWFDLRLPGVTSDQGELTIANVLSQVGKQLLVDGTAQQDLIAVNLQNGLSVAFGNVDYRFAANQINSIEIDAGGDGDRLTIVGSSQAEKIYLNSTLTTLESSAINLRAVGVEEVSFSGNGGADSGYLYDSNGDDVLTLRPQQAEMIGAGYKFNVTDTDRIFIHATSGGRDIGYVYDSAGDDRLSVRPQFSSISGAGYYNYISGVERLYAYATAGGHDVADLYDSSGNDRFTTSGESASITGPGFASYTKFFEQVDAHASAGGVDTAMLYGSSQSTQWQRGADFVSFHENTWAREARGFDAIDTFVAGQTHALAAFSMNAEVDGQIGSVNVQSTDITENAPSLGAQQVATAFPVFQNVAHELEHSLVSDREVLDRQLLSEPLSGSFDLAGPASIELQLLDTLAELQQWMPGDLDLPEEALMFDAALERKLMDSVFEQFGK